MTSASHTRDPQAQEQPADYHRLDLNTKVLIVSWNGRGCHKVVVVVHQTQQKRELMPRWMMFVLAVVDLLTQRQVVGTAAAVLVARLLATAGMPELAAQVFTLLRLLFMP